MTDSSALPGGGFSPPAERILPRGWYATCVAFLATPEPLRREISAQTLATYRRIKRLPRPWGEALDIRGAPLSVARWIAWGRDKGERERRYEEVMAWWARTGKWPPCNERRGSTQGW